MFLLILQGRTTITLIQNGLLCSFMYGIIIRMRFLQSEDNSSHIHAIYNEDVATIEFKTGGVIEGQ